MASVRTFIALELPGVVGRTLADTIGVLKVLGDKVRWVRPEGVHLTLKFLGDIEESRVPEVVACVQQASGKAAPLMLRTSGLGGFPDRDRARVVWVGIAGDLQPLALLQKEIEEALAQIGFPEERRKFFAHLTLGRVRRRPVSLPSEAAESVQSVNFRVDRVTVMKSDLRPEGAVYTPLGYGLIKGT